MENPHNFNIFSNISKKTKKEKLSLTVNIIAVLLIINIIIFLIYGLKCYGCLWYRPTIIQDTDSFINLNDNTEDFLINDSYGFS